MDASLLMASGYLPPLSDSQLPHLVASIFNPDAAARLRHLAARQFLLWRRQRTFHTTSLSRNAIRPIRRATDTAAPPALPSAVSRSPAVLPATTNPPYDLFHPSPPSLSNDSSTSGSPPSSLSSAHPVAPATLSPYSLARLHDHTQREERLAQVHLARWAATLQRALHNERARFAAVRRIERAAWLQDRLDECLAADAQDGEALGVEPELELRRRRSRSQRRGYPKSSGRAVDPRDPLGLLAWREGVRAQGILLVKVLSGAGLVGAVALWAYRVWSTGLGSGWAWSGWSGGDAGDSAAAGTGTWRGPLGWIWGNE